MHATTLAVARLQIQESCHSLCDFAGEEEIAKDAYCKLAVFGRPKLRPDSILFNFLFRSIVELINEFTFKRT